MKQYKHQTASRFKAKSNYSGTNYILCVTLCMGVEDKIDVSEAELLALGFEEVVEEKMNWIDEAFEMYYKGELEEAGGWAKAQDNKVFRQAIEKHMPRQKKYTNGDVLAWGNNINAISFPGSIINFLRDHDLLEE